MELRSGGSCLVIQSCPTLWTIWSKRLYSLYSHDPMDCSLPDSSVHGIFQSRILEWVAIPFFRGIFPTQELNPHLLHWQADRRITVILW